MELIGSPVSENTSNSKPSFREWPMAEAQFPRSPLLGISSSSRKLQMLLIFRYSGQRLDLVQALHANTKTVCVARKRRHSRCEEGTLLGFGRFGGPDDPDAHRLGAGHHDEGGRDQGSGEGGDDAFATERWS